MAGPRPVAAAETFYVDGLNPRCSDTAAGSSDLPYCTIGAAAKKRGGPGTIIAVRPAVYREQVTLSASGASGDPFVLRALGPGTILDGSDDFASPSLWARYSGDVWLASSVNWRPEQVFADGRRLLESSATPGLLSSGTFRYVSGQGLYVHAGGGSPGDHGVAVGSRRYGFRIAGRSWVSLEGFTVARTENRGIYLSSGADNVAIIDCTVINAGSYGISVSASDYVRITRGRVMDSILHGIQLTSGSDDGLIEDTESSGNARPGLGNSNGLQISGSTGNLVRGNRFHHNQDSGVLISSGSVDNRFQQNLSYRNGLRGFEHVNATGTIHVGDIAYANIEDGFSMTSGATGTRIHNSIAIDNGLTTGDFDLYADSESVPGFISDHNIWWNSGCAPPIRFDSKNYDTVATFSAATHHDARSLQVDPLFVDPEAGNFHLRPGSTAIDAADSSVPFWPATDAEGWGRVNDPARPDRGTGPIDYADRGAFEFLPAGPLPVANLSVSPSSGSGPLLATLDASGSSSPLGPIVSYLFDFGDGTASGPQGDSTAVHAFADGAWAPQVTITDAAGNSASATSLVSVGLSNQPPDGTIVAPAGAVTILVGQSVDFEGDGEDPDNNLPLTYLWKFDGGAPDATERNPGPVRFDQRGIYTVTLKVFDALGLADSTPDRRVINVTDVDRFADEIHFTYTGSDSVAFDWRGTSSSNTMRYGLEAGVYTGEVVAENPAPPNVPFSSIGPFWEARVTGLQPGTTYHYSIAGGPDRTFRTAPPRGVAGFTAWAQGDIGASTNAPLMAPVQSQIGSETPDMVLMLGDLAYGDLHCQKDIDQHFNDVMVWSRSSAYMPAWGNHEWQGSTDDLRNYKGRFDLPNPQASPGSPAISCCGEDWYWWDHGNVRFIVYPEPWSGAWQDWFPRAYLLMDQAQADPYLDFIVTFGHRPPYSSGTISGDSILAGYLDALGAAHPKYVLNLSGHSHDYERTHPQAGVVHLVVGTGGDGLDQKGACLWPVCTAPDWSAFRAMHLGALRLRFLDDRIEGAFICGPAGGGANDVTCSPGMVIDSFTVPPAAPQGTIDTPAGSVAMTTGESVTFTGTGSGDIPPLSYVWDFGGGAQRQYVEDPGPVVFAAPGIFTVTFTVSDATGYSDATPDTRTITVTDPDRSPNGTIDGPIGDVVVAMGDNVTFLGSGTDPFGNLPLTFAWDFGGAAPNLTVEDPGAVAFLTPGIYTVTLNVTNSLGLSDPTPAQRRVTVFDPNTAPEGTIDAPASDVTIRAGETVEFTATAFDPDGNLPLVYSWDFGGGAPSLAVENPGPVTFGTPGVYKVVFTVTDALGKSDPTPASVMVVVNPEVGEDSGIHYSFLDPQTVVFSWRGPDGTLRYGPTESYGWSVEAIASNPMPFSSTDQPFHEATIGGLEPDTLYHYAVAGGFDHTFRTPPPRGPAGFVVMAEGDISNTAANPPVAVVQSLVRAERPAFLLALGGLSYADQLGQEQADRHFDDMMVWSRDSAFLPAWGDHEWAPSLNDCGQTCGEPCPTQQCDDLRNYKGRFALPNSQESPGAPAAGCCGEDWYWFDYGHVRFIAVPEPYASDTLTDWQVRAGMLMDEAQADPDIRFIVTFGHRPAYSSGSQPGDPSLQAAIDALGGAHPRYVLHLSAHSRNYERSEPINGVIHVVAGTGGAGLEQEGACLWRQCAPPTWSAFRAMHLGVLRLRFVDDRIEGDFLCGPPGGGANDVGCGIGEALDHFIIPPLPPDGTIDAPAGPVTITAGQSVTFAGSGADPNGFRSLSYHWNFGGGAPDRTVEDPGPVIFPSAGTYTVTLTVSNAAELSDPTPATRMITVEPAPLLPPDGIIDSPALDPTVSEGQNVVFAGTGSDPAGNLPLAYLWDFGGGSPDRTVEDPGPVHFTAPGLYVVRFTVTNSIGLADPTPATRTVTVQPLPNLVANPSFETDTSGWKSYLSSTVSRVTGGYEGSYALRVTGPATTGTFGVNDSPNWIAVTPAAGVHYHIQAWVRSPGFTGRVRWRLREYLNGTLVGSLTYSPEVTLSPTWQKISFDHYSLSAGSTLDLQILDDPVAPGESFDLDAVSIKAIP